MRKVEYDTLPIKIFYKLLSDEKANLDLLGIDDLKEAKKVWESIKDEWREKHPSRNSIRLSEALKKVIRENIELSKRVYLLKLTTKYYGNVEECYKAAKVKFIEDPEKRYDSLVQGIEKSKTKTEIFETRYKNIEEEIKENEENKVKREIPVVDINASIASMEMHGFTIDNYEELTCGKYDAITKIIKDKK